MDTHITFHRYLGVLARHFTPGSKKCSAIPGLVHCLSKRGVCPTNRRATVPLQVDERDALMLALAQPKLPILCTVRFTTTKWLGLPIGSILEAVVPRSLSLQMCIDAVEVHHLLLPLPSSFQWIREQRKVPEGAVYWSVNDTTMLKRWNREEKELELACRYAKASDSAKELLSRMKSTGGSESAAHQEYSNQLLDLSDY